MLIPMIRLPVRGLRTLASSMQAGTVSIYDQGNLCNLASYLAVCAQGLQRHTTVSFLC
jgi:hypothetical protein